MRFGLRGFCPDVSHIVVAGESWAAAQTSSGITLRIAEEVSARIAKANSEGGWPKFWFTEEGSELIAANDPTI